MSGLFLADLENEVDTLREEVLRLKGMVSSLDRERDLLQQEVDQKAELLVEAESKRAKLVIRLLNIKLFVDIQLRRIYCIAPKFLFSLFSFLVVIQ